MDDDRGLAAGLNHFLDRADHWLGRNLSDLLHAPILGGLLSHARLSARGILVALVALLLLCVVPPITELLLRKRGCIASNFRGEVIPKVYGLAILACAIPLLLLDAIVYSTGAHDRLLWTACTVAFAGLGLLDDLIGDKQIKGFRGHVTALIKHRKLTTGLIKAVGGLSAAAAIGVYLHPTEPVHIVLTAAIIALSANFINLLDLRPGRACGAFCVLALLLLAALWRQTPGMFVPGLLYIFIPTLVVWTHDADAHVMLGDTGSNLLGASLGLAVCLYCGIMVQVAVLVLVAALHLLAEKVSITQLVERNNVLRAIDRLTGVR